MITERPLILNKRFFLRSLKAQWKFLTLCSIVGLILGILLNTFVIAPRYTSRAKMLIKGARQPNYITALEAEGETGPLTHNGNPVLTQIEVLNSVQLASRVIEGFKQTTAPKQRDAYMVQYADYFDPAQLAKKLKMSNPASTDVVTLKLSSPDPALSMILINGYVDHYRELLQTINQESLRQRGLYLQDQIKSAENKLQAVRQELMLYRQNNDTVDLGGETQSAIQQTADLEKQEIALASQISAKQNMLANLRRQLGMSTRRGIQSVALGMNGNLAALEKTLDETQQEYQTLSVKYTDESPNMQSLKAKITEIQQQIQNESRRTIGSTMATRAISDPVRSNLVDSMVRTESELSGLLGEKRILSRNLQAVRVKIQSYPAKQRRLADLMDSEKVLASSVDMLKMKAHEAMLRASDDMSNVVVIDSATLPEKPEAPTPKHILFLMTLAGLMGGMVWVLYRERGVLFRSFPGARPTEGPTEKVNSKFYYQPPVSTQWLS